MTITRREFVSGAGAVTLGFLGLRALCGRPAMAESAGYGELLADPQKILDLPKGFSYRVFSRTGERMDDGLLVPAKHDGMAAFAGPGGRTILVRNHENSLDVKIPKDGSAAPSPFEKSAFGSGLEGLKKVPKEKVFDYGKGVSPGPGGTTTLVYHTKAQQLERHFLSLAGTVRNCAGGPTPWGSWLSCEEVVLLASGDIEQNHGYVFEVPARAEIGLADPVPLKAMGRFNHEAVAVDPKSGSVYETEDRNDGLIYRFLPKTREKLADGGRLQALAVKGRKSLDTRNWETVTVKPGDTMDAEWIDLEDPDDLNDGLRARGFAAGAACFARGEGMWYGRDAVYFCCTNGGKEGLGQIWRYVPSPEEGQPGEKEKPGKLELFIESSDKSLLEYCDNVCVAPWGDLVISEDAGAKNDVVGVTPDGRLYKIARNAMNDSEFAGGCFSPDGSTLFVNIQAPGLTLAITGPWKKGG